MDLWAYALSVYGSDGVSGACLTLQDSAGVDVPLLLWALWAQDGGAGVDAAALASADAAVAPWRAEVVHPLRAVRRRMKTGPSPAPGPESEALRDRVKAAELAAEKIELDQLEGLPLPRAEHETGPEEVLALVLRHFAGRPPAGPEAHAIAVIAAAARARPHRA